MFLAACASAPNKAPVVEKHPNPPQTPAVQVAKDWRPQVYTVQKGDTLFGIALEFGMDYKDLAQWNGIANIDKIVVGRELKLYAPKEQAVTRPLAVAAPPTASPQLSPTKPAGASDAHAENTDMLKSQPLGFELPYSEQALQKPQAAPLQKPEPEQKSEPDQKPEKAETKAVQESDEGGIDWGWPAEGKVVTGFSESANLKGIDISGKMGQPVLASASGKVVYTGSNLRGYGKLVIVKHDKTYLSAYAHNSRILVREGQSVSKGDKIGEMGDSDASQVMLHFEIRRFGKPVDPMNYLKTHDQGAHR